MIIPAASSIRNGNWKQRKISQANRRMKITFQEYTLTHPNILKKPPNLQLHSNYFMIIFIKFDVINYYWKVLNRILLAWPRWLIYQDSIKCR